MILRPLLALAPLPLLAASDAVPPAIPAGEPVTCISTVNLRTHVRSDSVIDFVSGRRAWRVTLPQPCPGLGFDRAIAYAVPSSRLCAQDIVTVLQSPGATPGAACGLAPFQPVTLPRRDR